MNFSNVSLNDRFTNSKNIDELNKTAKCRSSIQLDDPSIKSVKCRNKSKDNKIKPAKLNPKLIQLFEQADAKNKPIKSPEKLNRILK